MILCRPTIFLFVAFLLGTNFFGHGQKKIEKIIDASGINRIVIDSDVIFYLEFTTTEEAESKKQIQIKSGISGETYETMLLDTQLKGGILYIGAQRSVYFEDIDDKLAAHKVLSVVVKIELPTGLDISITSATASVMLAGKYKNVNINLNRGDCNLSNFRASGTINTEEGTITGYLNGATIDAQSRHGRVSLSKPSTGSSMLKIRSIHGDISLDRSR